MLQMLTTLQKRLISFPSLSCNSLRTTVTLRFLGMLRIVSIADSACPKHFYKVLKCKAFDYKMSASFKSVNHRVRNSYYGQCSKAKKLPTTARPFKLFWLRDDWIL